MLFSIRNTFSFAQFPELQVWELLDPALLWVAGGHGGGLDRFGCTCAFLSDRHHYWMMAKRFHRHTAELVGAIDDVCPPNIAT
jgi:hypothetical protein